MTYDKKKKKRKKSTYLPPTVSRRCIRSVNRHPGCLGRSHPSKEPRGMNDWGHLLDDLKAPIGIPFGVLGMEVLEAPESRIGGLVCRNTPDISFNLERGECSRQQSQIYRPPWTAAKGCARTS